jgi:hypothetical protein
MVRTAANLEEHRNPWQPMENRSVKAPRFIVFADFRCGNPQSQESWLSYEGVGPDYFNPDMSGSSM